jgi:hypothetical protein
MVRFWDRATGLPLRPPLPLPGGVMNLTLSADGRSLIADTNSFGGIHIFDVAELLPRAGLPPEEALLLAEIDAAAEIHGGAIEPLAPAAWMKKWRQFRQRHPEWHQWPPAR